MLQVTQDAQADVLSPDPVQVPGETPSEQRCNLLELVLALAPGLDASSAAVLYKAAKPALQVSSLSCPISADPALPCRVLCNSTGYHL
jgi:hypothetical protein